MDFHGFLFRVVAFAVTGASVTACFATPNYLSSLGPKYERCYASGAPPYNGTLKIISWNIKFSQHIDEAISEFQTTPELRGADIILLQEMDAAGVDAIARALKMNALYYPASVHPQSQRDFGEAILSPWPLSEGEKIILPHYSPRNGQIRMAVRARVQTPAGDVLAYSIHTETVMMPRKKRLEQVETLFASVPDNAPHVIIGGDFNTLAAPEQKALLQAIKPTGFRWLTASAGPTVKKAGFGVVLDFLFGRGVTVHTAGAVSRTDASDHLPLWTTVTLAQSSSGRFQTKEPAGAQN